MRRIRAFLLGVVEFRSMYTTHFSRYSEMLAYDSGRDLAHRLTFRKFEA